MTVSSDWFDDAQKHHQAQRFAEAETLYRQTVDADATHLRAWHHLGLVCLAQNKLPEAAESFEHVLAISATNVDALTQLGIVLARQEHLPEAVAKFRKAIELRPKHAKAHNNLGVALTQMGKRDEGMACYRKATEFQPDYVEAHFNLAVAQADRKQTEEAIASYQRALQIRPEYVDALYNVGLLLVNDRRAEEAVPYLEQAVRIAPENPEGHNNLSLALADVGRFADAVASSDAALRLRPLDPKSHMNRGNAISSMGRLDAALACYDFALRLQPDYVNAHWNRSLVLLAQGDFEHGWAEYEYRWKKPETKTRTFPQPRWDGSTLDGKTILLWCEQGLGDTLQFVRYGFELKKRGAMVWLQCPEKLMALLSTCRGIDRLFAENMQLPGEFDCHAPLMSLPFLCKTTLSNVPADTPYLFPDAKQAEKWLRELGVSRNFKIGIAWQGNPKHRWDRHRSFPLHWFRSLAMLQGVELYGLQKEHGADQLSMIRFPITDLGSRLDDQGAAFVETAAVLPALDLIITCDSALAHLASAMGLHVWVVMSELTDWRWLRDRDDTPWYPTMRFFRQSKLGEWRPVFERLTREVSALRQLGASQAMTVHSKPLSVTEKGLDWPELLHRRAEARVAGETIVWVNGCFDLLHAGHIRTLQAARNLGDLLVVGINSDASVGRLKGRGRPIMREADRLEMLAALACVDFVVVFDDDTPLDAIIRLQPDIRCKGADHTTPNGAPDSEATIIEAYGGRIAYLPLVPGLATAELIHRIRDKESSESIET